MITYSAASYLVDTVSGAHPRAMSTGEVFPEMEDAKQVTLSTTLAMFARAPRILRDRIASLVPASIRSAWTARALAAELDTNLHRLGQLGPHFLEDIGFSQVAADVYWAIETDKPATAPRLAKPAVIRFEAPPAVRPARATSKRARRALADLTAGRLAGAVSA